MFKCAVDNKFMKRLVNGAFWEELPSNGHIAIKNSTLTKYFNFLDPKLARDGLDKVEYISKELRRKKNNADLREVSSTAVENYTLFLEQIKQEDKNLSEDELAYLAKPLTDRLEYELEKESWDEL